MVTIWCWDRRNYGGVSASWNSPPAGPSASAPPPSPGFRPAGRPRPVLIAAIGLAVVVIAAAVIAIGSNRSTTLVGDPTQLAAGAPVAAAKSALGPPLAPLASVPAADPNSVQSRLPEIVKFVEDRRGLKFKTPVKVTALDDVAFRQHIANGTQTAKDTANLENAAKELKAFGLIGLSVDVTKAEQALLGGSVVGLYDKKAKELFVRGTKATPYVREVLAHELTHGLQDQWFGLSRPQLDNASDESGEAFLGLVEGDAETIQSAYRASLSPPEQQQAADEESAIGGTLDKSIPQVLVDILVFPYVIGPQFVGALMQSGGQARLDAAFKNPPTTTRQLLDPNVYLAGQGAVPIALPSADGPVFDKSVLGEYGLLLLLEESFSPPQAGAAASEWGGDQYVAWQTGTRICVRTNLIASGPSSVLAAALVEWAKKHPKASVSGSGPFVITACT